MFVFCSCDIIAKKLYKTYKNPKCQKKQKIGHGREKGEIKPSGHENVKNATFHKEAVEKSNVYGAVVPEGCGLLIVSWLVLAWTDEI
jgi:hypothetical protein